MVLLLLLLEDEAIEIESSDTNLNEKQRDNFLYIDEKWILGVYYNEMSLHIYTSMITDQNKIAQAGHCHVRPGISWTCLGSVL